MRLRRVLLCIPALAFLLSAQFGLHFHVEETNGRPASSHHEHSSYFASELSSAHLAEHLLDDDIDVDNQGMLSAKLTIPAMFMLAIYSCFLVFVIARRRTKILRPDRPLRPPRRVHLLPPSQAPPISA